MRSRSKKFGGLAEIAILFSLLLFSPCQEVRASSLQTAGVTNCVVNFEFDQDGVLPSSLGFTYVASPFVPENSVFSVSGGLLHVNTSAAGGSAWYQLSNAYDPSQEFTLEFRMKVLPGTGSFGIDFEISDSVSDFEFGFADNGVTLPPMLTSRPFLPFNTTDDFHIYKVVAPGGLASYQLFIDGMLIASGNVSPNGDPGQRFIFGDGTGGAIGRAEIDFVRYCQQPASQTVTIDIKPDSFPNSINLGSNGVVPVAILSTSEFDAATVDPLSVTLAGAHVRLRGKGTPMASLVDVNDDGLLDLVVHVSTDALVLTETDTQADLAGKTLDGVRIEGTDSVRVVP
jgi:hypothetical protein